MTAGWPGADVEWPEERARRQQAAATPVDTGDTAAAQPGAGAQSELSDDSIGEESGRNGQKADHEAPTESLEAGSELGTELDTAGDTADSHDSAAEEPAPDDDRADVEAEPELPAGHLASTPRGNPRYDWPTIKRRYVEGVIGDSEMMEWPSLDAVAAHFGVGAQRVREKSAIEGWVEQRNRWQAKVEATRRNARAAQLSKSGLELDSKALTAAQLGMQLCMTRLQEIASKANRNRTQGAGLADAAALGIDAKEQTALAQAVDLWYKIGTKALGDPDTRVEISGPNGRPIEIAAELRRDDPGRITGVLAVLQQAGLGTLFGAGGADDPEGALGLDGRVDGNYASGEAGS